MSNSNSMNRRRFLAAATATLAATRRRAALPGSVLGVAIRREPLSSGKRARVITLWDARMVQVNTSLSPIEAFRAAAAGVFYSLRDRPTTAVIGRDGSYWNSDTDPDVLADREARRRIRQRGQMQIV